MIPFGIDPEPFAGVGPAAAGAVPLRGTIGSIQGCADCRRGGGTPAGRRVGDRRLRSAGGRGGAADHPGGWGDRIRLLGEVPDDALPALLARSRALVLPSLDRSETFGLCLLEAMAAGRPVVTSDLDSGVLEVNEAGVTGWGRRPGTQPRGGGSWRRSWPIRRRRERAARRDDGGCRVVPARPAGERPRRLVRGIAIATGPLLQWPWLRTRLLCHNRAVGRRERSVTEARDGQRGMDLAIRSGSSPVFVASPTLGSARILAHRLPDAGARRGNGKRDAIIS